MTARTCAAPTCAAPPTWTVTAVLPDYAPGPIPVCDTHRDVILRSLEEQAAHDPAVTFGAVPW